MIGKIYYTCPDLLFCFVLVWKSSMKVVMEMISAKILSRTKTLETTLRKILQNLTFSIDLLNVLQKIQKDSAFLLHNKTRKPAVFPEYSRQNAKTFTYLLANNVLKADFTGKMSRLANFLVYGRNFSSNAGCCEKTRVVNKLELPA